MASDTPERAGGRGDAALVHDRARVVRRYLSALDMQRPGRSAARTAETISHRIHQVDTLLMAADPVQRLHLTQERIDLHAELLRITSGAIADAGDAEAAFVRVVRGYSERHGITFSAWRQIGVATDVLERGGITASKQSRPAKPAAPKSAEPAEVVTEPAPPTAPPKPKPAAAKPAGAAKRAGIAKPAGAAKKARVAKKAALPEQQQLPADASS